MINSYFMLYLSSNTDKLCLHKYLFLSNCSMFFLKNNIISYELEGQQFINLCNSIIISHCSIKKFGSTTLL